VSESVSAEKASTDDVIVANACGRLGLAAIHEAGHAVIGWMRGQCVRERGLSITDDGRGVAHVRSAVVIPRTVMAALSPDMLQMADENMWMDLAFHVAGYPKQRKDDHGSIESTRHRESN
jgi:hypothetical protein